MAENNEDDYVMRVLRSIQHDLDNTPTDDNRPLPIVDLRRMWDEVEALLGRRIW